MISQGVLLKIQWHYMALTIIYIYVSVILVATKHRFYEKKVFGSNQYLPDEYKHGHQQPLLSFLTSRLEVGIWYDYKYCYVPSDTDLLVFHYPFWIYCLPEEIRSYVCSSQGSPLLSTCSQYHWDGPQPKAYWSQWIPGGCGLSPYTQPTSENDHGDRVAAGGGLLPFCKLFFNQVSFYFGKTSILI